MIVLEITAIRPPDHLMGRSRAAVIARDQGGDVSLMDVTNYRNRSKLLCCRRCHAGDVMSASAWADLLWIFANFSHEPLRVMSVVRICHPIGAS
jgi:hypothetical protein